MSEKYRLNLPYPDPFTPFASGSGDEFKLWNGSSEEDLLAAGWTYGRDSGNYWTDGDNGLYIRKRRPYISRHSCWLKYRYGNKTVPDNVSEATIKIVVRRILKGNMKNIRKLIMPDEAGEAWPYNNGAPSWTEIESLLSHDKIDLVFGT